MQTRLYLLSGPYPGFFNRGVDYRGGAPFSLPFPPACCENVKETLCILGDRPLHRFWSGHFQNPQKVSHVRAKTRWLRDFGWPPRNIRIIGTVSRSFISWTKRSASVFGSLKHNHIQLYFTCVRKPTDSGLVQHAMQTNPADRACGVEIFWSLPMFLICLKISAVLWPTLYL